MIRICLILAALAALAACAPARLDPMSCAPDNWYNLGYEDGQMGRDRGSYDTRLQQCRGEGQPEPVRWEEGYRAGLAEWCRPLNAYRRALEDGVMPEGCPEPVVAAYREGRADSWRWGVHGEYDRGFPYWGGFYDRPYWGRPHWGRPYWHPRDFY